MLGDCYEAAGRYILDSADNSILLVHGEVQGQGKLSDITFGHAWIEDGNTVIDMSNGRNLKLPKLLYYAIGRIDELNNLYKYTPQQARTKILKFGHWGPWDLKTRY